jgi:hypothetical protein
MKADTNEHILLIFVINELLGTENKKVQGITVRADRIFLCIF